jgi:hypothetical protein
MLAPPNTLQAPAARCVVVDDPTASPPPLRIDGSAAAPSARTVRGFIDPDPSPRDAEAPIGTRQLACWLASLPARFVEAPQLESRQAQLRQSELV